MTARCGCGEPSCRTCGTPVDGAYPSASTCGHPEPDQDRDIRAWDAWADDHPWSTQPGVGRVCVATTEKAA